VEEICNKAYKTLGLLERNISTCPLEVKLQAYKGHIRPVLETCSAAWDPHQLYLQEKLESVQKRAVRFITSNYNYEPGTMTTLLKQIDLPSLKDRRQQNIFILMNKGVNKPAHININILQRSKRSTKNQHSLRTQSRTDVLKYSFSQLL
jgi:hypothetical protein